MKHCILYIILQSFIAISYAQFLPADEIFQRTAYQSTLCPPEKIHLHTDRDKYVAGERIWMRAHIVDGIAHVPMKLSRYAYAALQNPLMEIVAHVRLYRDKDGYIYGYMPLAKNLPKGEYTLIAYTKYMKNFDNAYYWKKKIRIDSSLSSSIQIQSSINSKILSLRFANPTTGETIFPQNCSIQSSDMKKDVKTGDSTYTVNLHDSDAKTILVRAGNYAEYISISDKKDYDVCFLPEGGKFIPETINRIAFKAINELGQGEDITGTIRDERDSVIIPFNSLHRGMGQIMFRPEKDKQYTAVCKNVNGLTKRFQLPKAEDKYTMQVNQFNGKIYVKVLFSPYTKANEKLIVFAHQRGWPVKIGKWSKETPGLVCKQTDFIDGTASFLLLNERGEIVSERMVFIQNKEVVETSLISNDSIYLKRKKVKLNLKVKEKWWKGDCSVAITDNTDVSPDSSTNILTTLLLTSDLRGYIENPNWYFNGIGNEDKVLRKTALDVLMMTQGWKKYDISKAWDEDYHEPSPIPELWQEISGRILTRTMRKPIAKANVQLMAPSFNLFKKTKTDESGHFRFVNFDAPDSTIYWISALTNKNKSNIVLELDSIEKDIIPLSFIPPYYNNNNAQGLTSNKHLEKVGTKLMYEDGSRHIYLDEITVTAPKNLFTTPYEKINGAKSIKRNKIDQSGITDLLTFLRQQYPSISWIEQEGCLVLQLRGSAVTVIFDDFMGRSSDLGSHEILRNYSTKDVEQIDIITPPFSLSYDSKSPGGIIAITTKSGNQKTKWHPTNLKTIMPMGFQQPIEFYAPKYELQTEMQKKEPDLRTTIHWQPRLEVKNGKANIEFYTADGTIDYTVVIEGVGEDGSLLRVEKRIN